MKDNPFKIQEGAVNDADVKGWLHHRQSGDYLNFDFSGKAQHLGKFFDTRKLQKLFYIFVVICALLFVRTFYLQVISGTHYRAIAEGNRISSEVVTANRGLIYDRFGELLVKNVSYFFLYLLPDRLPVEQMGRDNLLKELSSILGVNREELATVLNKKYALGEEILIYENIPHDQAVRLMVLSDDEPALRVSFEPRRLYFPELGLSHAIGYLSAVAPEDLEKNNNYVQTDRIGKTGLEQVYEKYLRGHNGVIQYEVDALFRKKEIIASREPKNGQDITLTIDSKAQKKLYEIMETVSRSSGKTKMSAIVLNPKNGDILALNNLPTYNNNIYTTVLDTAKYQEIINDPDKPLLNRAIAGTYPLGSVFKLVLAGAALQEKIIDTNFKVHSVGGITVGGRFFPDWRPGGHGWTDVYWAIADSVNTFFYSVGGGNNEWLTNGLGVDKIIEYAKKFGMARPTGIDLPGEADGFLPSKDWKEKTLGERWYLGDTYNLSIGQGFMSVTPMQAAMLMSYYANNGTAFKPHLLKDVGSGENKKPYVPEIALTNLISSDNLNIVRQALRQTVTKGTAQSLQSVSVPVAGKTGTAQFRSDKTPHSWFAGFAPYDDPQIVITVLVEEGGDVGYAVKVSREFMEWYFSQ